MNNKDEWTYKNEWAEENGIDPRDELKRFVFGNFPFITEKSKKKFLKTID